MATVGATRTARLRAAGYYDRGTGVLELDVDMYETALPIREDLLAAHREVVRRWAKPGTWWNAAERRAIVEQVRRARDAETVPPPWVPVTSLEGLTGDDDLLPAAAIDAIWRITNHPGTLTADWYETITDAGSPSTITATQYTELVGVVAQSNCIDRFADALSLARPALPEPAEGEPTRVTPEAAMPRDHWVPTVDLPAPEVIRALSGVPAENEAMFALSDAQYVPLEEMQDLAADRNSLNRMQVELVAARTSKLNECFY